MVSNTSADADATHVQTISPSEHVPARGATPTIETTVVESGDYVTVDGDSYALGPGAALRPLVNVETGETIVSKPMHEFEIVKTEVGEFSRVWFVGQHGASRWLFTEDGEEVGRLDNDCLAFEVVGGAAYLVTFTGHASREMSRVCVRDPVTGEKLSSEVRHPEFRGLEVYGTFGTRDEVVAAFEPEPLWELENMEDEVIEPPEVTTEVESICEAYVENDMGWVCDLEADLETALS